MMMKYLESERVQILVGNILWLVLFQIQNISKISNLPTVILRIPVLRAKYLSEFLCSASSIKDVFNPIVVGKKKGAFFGFSTGF